MKLQGQVPPDVEQLQKGVGGAHFLCSNSHNTHFRQHVNPPCGVSQAVSQRKLLI